VALKTLGQGNGPEEPLGKAPRGIAKIWSDLDGFQSRWRFQPERRQQQSPQASYLFDNGIVVACAPMNTTT